MNSHLENIKELLQELSLPENEKQLLLKTVSDADKEFSITEFKLETTEKVKRTTAILLEQTIEELEKKRKAVEEKKRELEIEAALEKVRTRTMSMQKSDELSETAFILFQQFKQLGDTPEQITIGIVNEDESLIEFSLTIDGSQMNRTVKASIDEPMVMHKMYEGWKDKKKSLVIDLSGQALIDYLNYRNTVSASSKLPVVNTSKDERRLISVAFFSKGIITFSSPVPSPPETIQLLEKFASVFDLTYTRFLDLKKAEAQARESQIQLALERIRSRSLAMHISTELKDVVAILFQQLKLLEVGFDGGAAIHLFNENSKDAMILVASPELTSPIQVNLPYDEKAFINNPIILDVWNAKLTGKNILNRVYSNEEKNRYFDYVFEHNNLETIPQSSRDFIRQADSYTASFIAEKNSLLGANSWSRQLFSEDDFEVLKRIANVFEQAYTRFLDLQKAEAQAKEAEIELALERIRARTMAMQKSDELPEAANLLFLQVQALGMPAWSAGYCIWEDNKKAVTLWMSSEGVLQPPARAPLTEDPSFIHMRQAYERGESFFVEEIGGEELVEHYKYMRTLPVVGEILDSIIEAGHPLPTFQIFHLAYFSQGFLLFITYEPVPGAHEIFKRFGKVFDQTYTRFLDLQKAEAQAREAQIELGLERVRARAMAMQKSDELTYVAGLLFEQVSALGIKTWTAGFNVWSEDNNSYVDYITSPNGGFIEPYTVDTEKAEALRDISDARKSGVEFDVQYVEGEKIKQLYYALTGLGEKQFEIMLQDGVRFPSHQYEHFVFGSKVSLMFITYEPVPNTHEIFKRFGKVFEQTYTRFLDLQKAEAQARESHIELGLERVRARAMAMQKSDELAELVHTVFKELTKLHFALDRCIIMINDPLTSGSTWWMSNSEEASLPFGSFVKYHEHPPYLAYINAWKAHTLKWKYLLQGTEKKEWDKFLFVETELSRLPQFVIDGMKTVESVFLNVSFNNFGSLTLASLAELSEEHFDILFRFAKVFDLTYTRFNDLQKAEAQTREAEIELALERVRARTMAMQQSLELRNIVASILEQLQNLGFTYGACSIVIMEKISGDMIWWIAGFNKDYPESYYIPFFDHPFYLAQLSNWKEGKEYAVLEASGEEKKSYDKIIFSQTEFIRIPPETKRVMKSFEKITFSNAYMKHGALSWSVEPISDEHAKILQRFAKVFEQSYTRFLDLQKSEAQAREAKIELALERVRARTMAMQRSEELQDAANLLFLQVQALDIPVWSCGYNIWEKEEKQCTGWMSSEGFIQPPFKIPLTENPTFIRFYESRKKGESFYAEEVGGAALAAHYRYMLTLPDFAPIAEKFVKAGFPLPLSQINHVANFAQGNLIFITSKPVPEAWEVFKRFAKVFEQTYTRFLDLQKAEAQAREAQIEVALERVRSRTMAMQKSDELPEISFLLFQQVKELGLTAIQNSIVIVNEKAGFVELSTTVKGSHLLHTLNVPIDEPYLMSKAITAWKAKHKSLTLEFEGQELKDYNELRNSFLETKVSFPEDHWIVNLSFFSKGWLSFSSDKNVSVEIIVVLKRFAAVFEQTYIRFLDLQKAESQARESQIQLALERVRARTMAMQRSDEHTEAAMVMFQQLRNLGVDAFACGFVILDKSETQGEFWMSSEGIFQPPHYIPHMEETSVRNMYMHWKKNEDFYVEDVGGEALKSHYKYLMELPKSGHNFQGLLDAGISFPEWQRMYAAYFSRGYLLIITKEKYKEENIFIRFAKVFEQTYTRFLDLQKAEAQAREATIENALEKVRSRSLAMHHSAEFHEVVNTVFKRLKELNIEMASSAIYIFKEGSWDYDAWIRNRALSQYYAGCIHIPYVDNGKNGMVKELYKAVLFGNEFVSRCFSFDEKNEIWNYLFEYSDFKFIPGERKKFVLEASHFTVSISHLRNTGIQLARWTNKLFSESENDILKRFAKVFEQAYTRFLDLQKAEVQTKEAIIEAALERVRTKTMAMHNSRDVGETAVVMFKELEKLHVAINRCGILIFDQTKHMQVWTAAPDTVDTAHVIAVGALNTDMHPLLQGGYNSWQNKEPTFFYFLQGQDLLNYYTALSNEPTYPYELAKNLPATQACSLFYFPEGGLYAFTTLPLSNEAIQIFTRFAGVFALTYRRYLDLQIAESQARQAIKQASLDRVRAEIASMRSTADLEKITPLIWDELTTLGVPFIRCGVFIMDEQLQQIHTFLSSPDGEAIASFLLAYSVPGTSSEVLEHWRKKEMFKDHWNEADFTEWTKNLVQQGAIASSEKYTTKHPPTNLDLYFLPFLQGMLYVGNEAPLSSENIQLVQTLADAFSTAYARYEDFNKLESAKQQIENTLVDLRQAQAQLVQSEKMASLGELTAGIAHEIQNPLNFINNFSDVNKELIEELEQEAIKGNIVEVKALASDLRNNEQKINHHGKRADAIVKGMLQHSRTNTGQKELVDINALADEYLRLSYHGCRAKDKFFNTSFETHFDDTLEKIAVVPQDIGRVFLNIFNNAFYACAERSRNEATEQSRSEATERSRSAVSEQKKVSDKGYEPKVRLKTSRNPLSGGRGAEVIINISDNGTGIPQKVVDKIFQPFFTTKPTGQGTGLGLSLSYDIIKAHGGEMKVETNEGEGAEFIIQLPI